MEDLISVIMPVYNVAPYLPQCLDSVLGQDHKNLEVIVVDDGSTDESGAICDTYAQKDSRVKVIHQKNGGAAAAKNAGLRVARGEYLSFVDSDDFLEPNVYGYMLNVLKSSGADAAHFSFREVYRNRSEEQHVWEPGTITDNQSYLVRFTKDWTCSLLWNKLYKRELFDGVFFEEGHKIDDEFFTYQGFLKKSKIVFDDRIIYNYRKRASSVMSSPEAAEQRILDCLDSMLKRRKKVVQTYPQLRKAFDNNYLDVVWFLSVNPGNTERSIAILRAHFKKYFRGEGKHFPPRFLWEVLLKYVVTSEKKLVQQSREKQMDYQLEDYFQ